ncbi:MAG: protein kinase [Planctomycetia bacterium]|nr:protein kinase [Planctomycetia bacterium]
MSADVPESGQKTGVSVAARIEAVRERFAAQLRAGQAERIDTWLGTAESADRLPLFRELLPIEWEYRRRRGEQLSIDEYVKRFPEYAAAIAELLGPNGVPGSNHPTLIPEPGGSTAEKAVTASTRYTELDFVAEGGLGEVFSAREEQLNRRVALKFIHSRHATRQDFRDRFVFEAEVASRLDHPGVVPVYAVGTASDGRPFYSMRFIHGDKLSTRIGAFHDHDEAAPNNRARSLELRALLRHLVSAANTLAYAHHRGVAHLDVKPDNIMIGSYGETLVLDWGLAIPLDASRRYELSALTDERTKFVESGDSPSGTGVGTPPYMSPEQCDETWAPVGPASDIYALGVTLYNVLTGQVPFSGRDFARDFCEPKCQGRFPRPSKISGQVPGPLEAICLKALAPRPADRYGKATEFADDIERWLADEPVSVYDEPWLEQVMRSTRRHRNWATSIAASILMALLVALADAAILTRARDRERTERLAAQQATAVAEDAKQRADDARLAALRMAARFAAGTVAREIDLRLRIVEAKAADGRLLELMRAAPGQPRDSEPRKDLQHWLEECKRDTQLSTKAESWYVNDPAGVQLARANFDESTIDQSFWYRDYFHGQGLDLPEGPPRNNVPPVRTAYVSNIYRSKAATGRLKVAFVHPIWSDAHTREEGLPPLGLLGMTVDVGEFRVLESGLDQQQMATLASLRSDVVEGNEATGMILHHRHLADMLAKQLVEGDGLGRLPRLDAELVARLQNLRQRRWELLQLDAEATVPVGGSLDENYRDVLSADPAARYLAIFEPVFVPWRSEPSVQDPGWVVIVQERKN